MNGAGLPYVVRTTQSAALVEIEKPDSLYVATGVPLPVRLLKATVTVLPLDDGAVVVLPHAVQIIMHALIATIAIERVTTHLHERRRARCPHRSRASAYPTPDP
jgi:hypothetical protein